MLLPPSSKGVPHRLAPICAGAYVPVYLARMDKLKGGTGRSLVYVLGNMFSAGGDLQRLVVVVVLAPLFCWKQHITAHILCASKFNIITRRCLCLPVFERDHCALQLTKHLPVNLLRAVMVSAGFCHLLGEALKQMPKMFFPLAPFLCGLGYLLTLVADKVVSSTAGLHGHGQDAAQHTVEVLAGMEVVSGRGTPSHANAQRSALSRLAKEGSSDMEMLLRPANTHSTFGQAAAAAVAAPKGIVNGGGRWASSEALHGGQPVMVAPIELGAGTMPPHATTAQHQRPEAFGVVLQDSLHSNGGLAGASSVQVAVDSGGHQVSFFTAVLMGVALCFHSLLEVRKYGVCARLWRHACISVVHASVA